VKIKKLINESIRLLLLERKSDFDEHELTTCILALYSNPANTDIKVVNLGNRNNPNHAIFVNLKKDALDVVDLNNTMFESKSRKDINDIIECFNEKSFNYNILKRLDFMMSSGSDHGAAADYIMYDDGTFSININVDVIYDFNEENPLKNIIPDLFVEKVFHDSVNSSMLKRLVYHEFSHFYTDIKSNYKAIKPDLSIKDEDLLKHNYANDFNENQARFAGIVADIELALSTSASGNVTYVSDNIKNFLTHLKKYQETNQHENFEKAVNTLVAEYNNQTYGWKKLTSKMKNRIEKRAVDIITHINTVHNLINVTID
tara:strand:- start:1823 stop:2770 length:948 start_codon:yes stop_codon:yes gene_type:complete